MGNSSLRPRSRALLHVRNTDGGSPTSWPTSSNRIVAGNQMTGRAFAATEGREAPFGLQRGHITLLLVLCHFRRIRFGCGHFEVRTVDREGQTRNGTTNLLQAAAALGAYYVATNIQHLLRIGILLATKIQPLLRSPEGIFRFERNSGCTAATAVAFGAKFKHTQPLRKACVRYRASAVFRHFCLWRAHGSVSQGFRFDGRFALGGKLGIRQILPHLAQACQ